MARSFFLESLGKLYSITSRVSFSRLLGARGPPRSSRSKPKEQEPSLETEASLRVRHAFGITSL